MSNVELDAALLYTWLRFIRFDRGVLLLLYNDQHHTAFDCPRPLLPSTETKAMGHVPKGLDFDHSTDRRRESRHHAAGAGGDGKHCQEAGCMKAASYGWDGAAVMCAQVCKQ